MVSSGTNQTALPPPDPVAPPMATIQGEPPPGVGGRAKPQVPQPSATSDDEDGAGTGAFPERPRALARSASVSAVFASKEP